MFRLSSGRNLLVLGLMACAVFLFASPGQAQTGALQGKVTDAAGNTTTGSFTVTVLPDPNCPTNPPPTNTTFLALVLLMLFLSSK